MRLNVTSKRKSLLSILLFMLLGIQSLMLQAATDLHRLTWTDDPATTMTIGWRQSAGTFSHVKYRIKQNLADWINNSALVQYNYSNSINGLPDTLNNSFVKLINLLPDTDYEYKICDTDGCSHAHSWFRTAPATDKTITFIAGGDSRRETSGNFSGNDLARKNGFKLIAKMRPLFVLFSGDYMNDGTYSEWLVWLDEWQLTKSNDGRMYPIIPTHGNHENDVLNMMRQIFNVEGPVGNNANDTYSALSFGGDMLRIWTLNTELEPGVGYSAFQSQSSTAWNEQTAWLNADLTANPDVTWKLVNYHRPLRPHTSSKTEGNLRYSQWAPLFDQHDVDLAIESDTHMVKYTLPVNYSTSTGNDEGFLAADYALGEHGTVFIGEGSWGAPKRPIDDDKSWTLISNSFWQFKHITVSSSALNVRTVRFETSSYPNGVDSDVIELTQAEQDALPETLATGIDLWAPFVGDGALQLPFTNLPSVKADANIVPGGSDPGVAPPGALFYNNFSSGFQSAEYGDIAIIDLACNDSSTDNWYVFNAQKASINGYNPSSSNTNENCNDWMILPPQDLTAHSAITLTFDSDYNYGGPELKLWYSSNYEPSINSDPTSASWQPLTFTLPTTDGYTITSSGAVVINDFDIPLEQRNSVYIAFQYMSNGRGAGDGRVWDVDNIIIQHGIVLPPVATSESFNGGSLGSWQTVNVASSSTWNASPVDGRHAASMQNTFTFSNADDWLVSPLFSIDANGANAEFNFIYRFVGATAQVPATDNFQLLVLPNCTLSGAYSTAMINPTDWLLLQNSFTGSESVWSANPTINLTAYNGQDICLAFRYRDAGFSIARHWAVDDLALGTFVPSVSDTIPLKDNNHLRVASFNILLADRGAGVLSTDLATGTDLQAKGIAEIIQRVNPDIVLLNEFDFDAAQQAIVDFKSKYLEVSQNGIAAVNYPYFYINISNTGVQPEDEGDPDCDFNDPNFGCNQASANDDPEDAYGFGKYSGAFGMALLSKYPIDTANIRTFRKFLWKDMPGNVMPTGYYQADEIEIFRLSSKSHWDIPVNINGEIVHVLGSHPTPPVFDGVEDRNGRRNHDEIRFWEDYVSLNGSDCYIYDDSNLPGCLGYGRRFVIMGDQNADPINGDSFADAILQIINNPLIDDSFSQSSSGGEGTTSGKNATADFGLRADYALSSNAGLAIQMNACDNSNPGLNCGIFWPRSGDPLRVLTGNCNGSGPTCASSDHRLVWLDLAIIPDTDLDTIPDDVDICPAHANSNQNDNDYDLLGDACDSDDDNDLMPDSWEVSNGLDPLNPVDAFQDNDGDNISNVDEFLAGTNPNIFNSSVAHDEDIPFLPVWALLMLAAGLSFIGTCSAKKNI